MNIFHKALAWLTRLVSSPSTYTPAQAPEKPARQMVTLQVIEALKPIEGADRIELAQVLGWQVVVKKGEFQVGDPCLWFEIDSFLPLDPRFEFLAKTRRTWNGHEGYRLKTVKLRGQISQGLALPQGEFAQEIKVSQETGKPLQDCLGVLKWEPEEDNSTGAREQRGRVSTFPSFIPKTDQTRAQAIWNKIDREAEYEATVKLDGSSITVYKHQGEIGVCSRNQKLDASDPENADNQFIRAARESGLVAALEAYPEDDLAPQGELVGPGIQKNRGNHEQVQIHIYDIYSIKQGRYLTPGERMEVWHKLLMLVPQGLKGFYHVPTVRLGACPELETLERALAWADAQRVNGQQAEGLVFKRLDGLGSFKVISNLYLVKHDL